MLCCVMFCYVYVYIIYIYIYTHVVYILIYANIILNTPHCRAANIFIDPMDFTGGSVSGGCHAT